MSPARAVSDILFNEPCKLTEKALEKMKRHLTAGREILSRAIDMFSEEDSGDFKETRNRLILWAEG